MVNTLKLKAAMVEKNKTRRDLAEAIGISEKTFTDRMKKAVFGSDEIAIIVSLLDIKDPVPIFFPEWVT